MFPSIALCVLIGILSAGNLTAQQTGSVKNESPVELLEKIVRCHEIADYSGTFAIEHRAKDSLGFIFNYVIHYHPDFSQIVCLSPPKMAGKMIYIEGTNMYTKDSGSDTLESKPSFLVPVPFTIDRNHFDLILKNYSILHGKDSMYLGLPVSRISILPHASDRPEYHLLMEKKYGLILNIEKSRLVSEKLFGFHYTSINFNPPRDEKYLNFSTDNFFIKRSKHQEFNSVEELEKAFGYSLIKIAYLPDGFMLSKARLLNRHGIKTVHLVYTDGMSSLSFFIRSLRENEKSSTGDTLLLQRHGTMNIVRGNKGKLHISCIGDLNEKTMERIFVSIK